MNYILCSQLINRKQFVVNTANIIKGHLIKMPSTNIIYDVPKNNSLFKGIHNLYHINNSCRGKRINICSHHSLSLATIACSLSKYSNVKLIWIDICPDLHTTYSLNTNIFNKMTVSFLTGIDIDTRFYFLNKNLQFNNILYIGIKKIDTYEKKIIDTCNINVITVEDVNQNLDKVIEHVNNFIGDNKFHVSLDLNSIDPYYIPSTNIFEKNGLHLDNMVFLMKHFYNNKNLINTDICSLNLNFGTQKDRIISLENTLKLMNVKT